MSAPSPHHAFRAARDFLRTHSHDYATAYEGFAWPKLDAFNWALDWFDVLAREDGGDREALRIVADDDRVTSRTFAELSASSNRVANSLRRLGVARGDRILVMLGNELPIWETMLAAMKLGAVVIPATTQLMARDLEDRFARGRVAHVIVTEGASDRFADIPGDYTRIVAGVGGSAEEGRAAFTPFERLYEGSPSFTADGVTRATDPLLLYFTSGTTAQPKLVLHTHASYPVGHLSTMYWLGLREGDKHVNISSPGWAKHAWSSLFAPWNAGATIVALDSKKFDAARTIERLRREAVSTLCAPPTVWRMMIQVSLGARPEALRELASAGEPLNPEVIERVKSAWGLTVRDGYGQTETTAQIGNPPGSDVVFGAMGKPLPGYDVVLLNGDGVEVSEGEIALRVAPARPMGLMVGYADDDARTAAAMANGYYRTGDEAARSDDGTYTYVARGDDVFKSSDYRISPFELESALLEHPAVAEAAIVPSPDALRLSVPKAFVVLTTGHPPTAETARELFAFCRTRLAAYKRVRRIEFAALPKTISGKIRRVELRALETARRTKGERGPFEYFVEELDGSAV